MPKTKKLSRRTTTKSGSTAWFIFSSRKQDDAESGEHARRHEQARDLKRFWLAQWPEARAYFDYIGKQENENGVVALQRFVTGSVRSNMSYTEACNDPFQSLGATAATWAGYDLARACYHDRDHVLFGSRPVNFIHDQYLVEVLDDERAHDRAMAVADIMVAAARRAVPDVTPGVEPLLCRYWSKYAKAIYKDGRLVPWPS